LKELTDTTLISTIPKNAREQVRVELSQYRGQDVLNLWVYYYASHPIEEWRPSKQGLSISTSHVSDLRKAINKAYEALNSVKGKEACI